MRSPFLMGPRDSARLVVRYTRHQTAAEALEYL